MPKASVIITTYNRAHLVGDAIDSVLKQTFIDFELIVVDDGSADNTEQVVGSYIDPRLKYIKQPNQGLPAARNTGIQAATGEYISFLDDDDIILPEKLALQVATLDSDPEIGLVYSLYYAVTETDDEMLKVPAGTCDPPLTLRRLLLGPWAHISTVLVRYSWVEKIGGFDRKIQPGDDFDFYIGLALAGCKMTGISTPLALIRQQSGSLGKSIYHREKDSIAFLDKAFSDPRLPMEMQELRNTAYAIQFILLATSAYLASQLQEGKSYLERAIEMDPSLVNENIDILVNRIINSITGLSLGDPEATLRQIVANMPDQKAFSNLKRRLWEKFYIQAAYQAYLSNQLEECKSYAMRAIINAPSSLRNRGLLSILIKSFLGRKVSTSKKFKPIPKVLPKI